jgi:histidyl-tRNA synthetase
MVCPSIEGSIKVVGGGGRYDGLVEQIGGPPTPGVGFGCGVERLLLALAAEGREILALLSRTARTTAPTTPMTQ